MKIIVTVILASFTTIVNGQNSKAAEKDASNGFDRQVSVKDYLNVPGPIKFANASYNLTWSTHPSSIYYKQEYIPAGDTVEHFNKLIMIDVVDSNMSLDAVIKEKIYWLENQKKRNPIVNYKLIQNPEKTEYLLDFIVSEGTEKPGLVEWNAYRYKVIAAAKGRKQLLLFGYIIRSYGDAIGPFMSSLRDTRGQAINALVNYPMPEINVSGK